MSVSVRFDAKELERSLKKLGSAKAQEILARSAFAGGEITAEEIMRRAPDSGIGRNSPDKSVRGKHYPGKLNKDVIVKQAKITARGVLVRVVSLPFYTRFVEFGTSNQAANPYVRRASRSARPKANDKFIEGVRNMVQDAFR